MPVIAPNPAYGAGLPYGWTVQNSLASSGGGGDQNLVDGGSAPASGLGAASPALNGLLAWTFDVRSAAAGTAVTSGQQYISKFYWPGGQMSNGWVVVTTASATATHGFLAVYDTTGSLWAQTADQGSAAFTAAGAAKIPFTAVTPVPSGYYYGYVSCTATTAPALAKNPGSVAAAVNLNETAGSWDFAVNTTAVTAVPASLAYGTGWAAESAVMFWFGVS
jgi:hypothetical protein